jgi:hypothetical protein
MQALLTSVLYNLIVVHFTAFCSRLVLIEVRFRDYGLKSIEVIDNGSGIAAEDYDSIGESRFYSPC